MHNPPERINTRWREGLADHIYKMEHFLTRNPRLKIEAESLVYIAGMLARQLDKSYRRQILPFLKSNPEEIFSILKKHEPYIGQNAPVAFLSRTNAEYMLIQSAHYWRRGYNTAWPVKISGKYFGIASRYSYKAGNFVLGDICAFIQNRVIGVQSWLGEYLEYRRKQNSLPARTSPAVWHRFGLDHNGRNDYKERWEQRGIDHRRLQRIPHAEFQAMIHYESHN